MSKVYLVIKDEGSHSDRDWEVGAICSSLEKAESKVRELLLQNCRKCSPHHQPDLSWDNPYFITCWEVDGEMDTVDETLSDAVERAVQAVQVVL